METKIKIADILLDSLPFIRAFRKKVVVIKYGGAAQINPKLKEQFAKDIVMMYMLGIKPIIVHGGGRNISKMLDDLGLESEFVNGHRVSSAESMPIIEMVLCGNINKELSAFLNYHGVKAVGISGKDAGSFEAAQKDGGKLGYTGEITQVDTTLLATLLQNGFVPVIAPIAGSSQAHHLGYNINADSVACEIAKALNAFKVIFLTDTKGVLDKNNQLFSTLNIEKIEKLKKDGVITGGMLPKIDACISCVQNGVQKVHIIDGRVEHSLLLELFTSAGIGTEIVL
ncbi:acetylglutamate kinase [Helicobacter sp. 11S03491-1]|uniref:acetylglutamate kinase n=1 Tax=Helicobacter sp. 11S03491-1 TaxID=1476196 RepID=UPI000BA715E0|nr:acetylglutamate kinase [Helicobacter sp. 11S03491-1]PAF42653.1 acetylglutamate kinase [Helicobacter sp. 11S03491-1]